MKSLTIKTSNKKIAQYFQNELLSSPLENVYYSTKYFKKHINFIMHYSGNDISSFYDFICNMITNYVIDNYEFKILKRLFNLYYFYFDNIEKNSILNVCKEIIQNKDYNEYDYRYEQIYISIYDYISNNRNIYIDGFIDFRLINYYQSLTNLLDIGVKKYLIDKEYSEFISLLKLYITLNDSSSNIVHAIYDKNNIILLDENLSKIDVTKYVKINDCLSDISFSQNDYVLNTLLNLIPKRIIIHAYDNSNNEFINTLKKIFENRLEFCDDCNICNLLSATKNAIYQV